MQEEKLSKAPLQEVIFEIRWDLDINPRNSMQYDKGFELAQGKFQNLIKDEFPFYIRKFPLEFPGINMLNYSIIHQFWKSSGEWPVIQLGPGIFSVNDTEKNYIWKDRFYPLIQSSIGKLFSAYEEKINVSLCNLRYIDAVRLNQYPENKTIDMLSFVRDNLKIDLKNNFELDGNQRSFNINQFFQLSDESELNILVTNGVHQKTREATLVWQTGITKKKIFNKEEIVEWCQSAHSIISPLFKKMTKGKLYDSFK